MSNWKDKLTKGQATVMQEIVDQVPTTMGLRDAIEAILDKLATGGSKFRFVIVTDGDVTGTNDETKARELGQNEDIAVIDTVNNKWLMPFDAEDEEEPGENDSEIMEDR